MLIALAAGASPGHDSKNRQPEEFQPLSRNWILNGA